MGVLCVTVLYFINQQIQYLINKLLNPVYFSCFIVGFLCARYNLFNLLSKYKNYQKYKIPVALSLLGGCIIIRLLLSKRADYNAVDILIVAPFVYSICVLSDKMHVVSVVLEYLGKNSTYMWLTHTFLITWGRNLIFFSKFTIVATILLLGFSLLVSIFLSYIEKGIDFGIKLIHEKYTKIRYL